MDRISLVKSRPCGFSDAHIIITNSNVCLPVAMKEVKAMVKISNTNYLWKHAVYLPKAVIMKLPLKSTTILFALQIFIQLNGDTSKI